jgi:hypothetical protein
MSSQNPDKKVKADKAKEYLAELRSSLKKIEAESRDRLAALVKKHDEKKVSDILKELKK